MGCCAGVVGKVGVGVCPFLFEGAVESFDFAVDLQLVGPGPFVLDAKAEVAAKSSERSQDQLSASTRLTTNAREGAEGVGADPELCGGLFALVAENLRIRQSTVVVHRVVHERVVAALLVVAAADRAPTFSRSTADRRSGRAS